ncbi:MAG: tetratricopeptide repeat protein [Bacteroidota bacterium]
MRLFFLLFVNIALIYSTSISLSATKLDAETNVSLVGGDSLKALGLLVERNKVSNNPLSIKYAKMALVIARQGDSKNDLVDAYKWIGKAYLKNHNDSSFYYYDKALKIADTFNLVKQKIHIFYNIASFYKAAYNYTDAMSLLDSSIRLAEMIRDPEGIANAYIELGNIKLNIHEPEGAKKMFELALKAAEKDTLYKQMGVAIGNLAKSHFEKDTLKSLAKQREALGYLGKLNGVEEEMATIYVNMGYQSEIPDSALVYYQKALKLAVNANLFKIIFGAYNNMAYSYLDKKDVQKAESCLTAAIPLAMENKDNDWLSSLYDTYADVCVRKGDFKKALGFQKSAMRARESDYKQKAAEQVRLLGALLNLRSKELLIQNEEKELLVQRNRLQKTELWLAITLIIVLGSFFTMFFLQQRSRARFHKEKIGSAQRIIEMEETEKGRVARELHDLTGQLILGMSGTIENIDFPEPEIKEQIKARIKELGVSIRQISHRMNRAMIEHFTFSEMITGLCEDVKKLSRMKVDLEMAEEFPDLPNELVLHFYRIIQELLTNAGKYAKESQVKIKIFAHNGKLNLLYNDNGPGFTLGDQTSPSMGILNIFERAKLVGGQANLKSAPGNGTSWEIIFPMEQKYINKI